MQRIAYIIIATVLVIGCSTYAVNESKEMQNMKPAESISDIQNSSQNPVQEETVKNELDDSSNSTTTSSEVSSESITQEQTPSDVSGKFKSYTNYKLLSRDSRQWTEIQAHEDAYTDKHGLRKVGKYYCVAMGTYYAKSLGDLFEIQTDGGAFKAIICDIKSDEHTDSSHKYTVSNGCVVEFYVDVALLDETAKQLGNVSCINPNFEGKILEINRLGNYFAK